ncbi:MAG: DUF1844 domain-containing protein [Candidatus Omnitrophica bacterium]|nr:DUF1844 domain-containing protein [Candidatus Omnitrophota bacterium]
MSEQAKNIEINFSGFISGLVTEGLAALGLVDHPALKGVPKNLQHASFVIDTMEMLKKKTQGNLDTEEDKILEESIHQLRILYITELNKGPAAEASKSDKPQEEKLDSEEKKKEE